LEQHGPVEEVELGDVGPAPTAVRQHLAGLPPQQLLLLGERELHQRDLGRPSTRSAMMLRRISLVPASIVLPRLRSCAFCQCPFATARSLPGPSRAKAPSISRAAFVRRWFVSDQNSLPTDPSGPGTPVFRSAE